MFSMKRTQRPVRGLSLVEMMVGIAVGLFVLAGTALMLTSQLHDGRKLMLETQVQQDMRSAADIVVRELRRAGFTATAAQAAWFRGTTGVQQSGYSAIQTSDSQVLFRYGTDTNNTVDTADRFGFRFREGAIQFQLGNDNWQDLTDAASLTVETFDISERVQTIDLDPFCPEPCVGSGGGPCGPRQIVREYTVNIVAHATRDEAVRRTLRAVVRPRNDEVIGACMHSLGPAPGTAPSPSGVGAGSS